MHARDMRGLTAFDTALSEGQFEAAKVLLDHGVVSLIRKSAGLDWKVNVLDWKVKVCRCRARRC